MLKKPVQQGYREWRSEEVPTALRGAVRSYNGSCERKNPSRDSNFRESLRTLRVWTMRERRWWTFSASC